MKLFIEIVMSIFCICKILTMGAGDMLKSTNLKNQVTKEDNEQQENILLDLKNGLKDPTLTAYYHQDIDDVKKFSNGDIQIDYYDVDLDGDGRKDKIVIIRSPLHSGVMGDSLQILLSDQIDNYKTIFYGVYQFYDQNSNRDEVLGMVHILKNKTNGFYDIEIVSDDNVTILKYIDGKYR